MRAPDHLEWERFPTSDPQLEFWSAEPGDLSRETVWFITDNSRMESCFRIDTNDCSGFEIPVAYSGTGVAPDPQDEIILAALESFYGAWLLPIKIGLEGDEREFSAHLFDNTILLSPAVAAEVEDYFRSTPDLLDQLGLSTRLDTPREGFMTEWEPLAGFANIGRHYVLRPQGVWDIRGIDKARFAAEKHNPTLSGAKAAQKSRQKVEQTGSGPKQ